ncbi:unnamed protein product [Parnassius mnemosyne]|uniref:Protein kinase domain-containing protein n=1 Tax=Parnassius mnemosyne TaxID=213953 RepID=A0AAV1KDK6_9NEOP
MRKFLFEYKARRSHSETQMSTKQRERVTVTTSEISPSAQVEQPPNITQVGTIRTEKYKRDLAEFQARRSSGSKDLQTTPVKRKCGRHSLPVSCTDCTGDPDTTFNYEKKSATKYKKKTHKVKRRSSTDEKVPNIQFLFQNQVFMPGNMFSSYSEPAKSRRHSQRVYRPPDMDFLVQRHIDFKEEDQLIPPPLFFKNNSLSFDVKNFLDTSRSDDVDGLKREDVKSSSHNSPVDLKKDDSCEDKMWEVMSELKNFDRWADEQLKAHSISTTKSDDNKSDASAYGLPITSSSDLSVTLDKTRTWIKGKWGVVPVQIKKIVGVTIEQIKKKRNTEINILRKCRHPNIILLMGLYPDVHNDVYIICERCVDSLYGILHVQGRIISAQTSVQYALDIANALVFLRMQGYLHSQLSSSSIMITSQDTAKLADVGPCAKVINRKQKKDKFYEDYSPEPQYINIQDANDTNPVEKQPLLPETISEAYLSANAIAKEYASYHDSELYRWQAPELFEPDARGLVYPCSKTDVYSLCLILWECCNAAIPWKTLKYEKLKEVYLTWKTGIRLPQDGTYPGGLLALLRAGLMLQRKDRPDLNTLQTTMQTVKCDLDDMECIIIPARLSKTKSNFSTQAWDTTSPTDSECQSPKHIQHKAVIHKHNSSTDSEKEISRSVPSPMYETIRKTTVETCSMPDRCFISDDDGTVESIRPGLRYEHLPEKDFSSACSTPIAKLHARIRENTPLLHKSDSTEYCSILSPDPRGLSLALNDDSIKDKNERSATKLSRSFTPQSYKPLHIRVPEFNLDSIKSIVKENGSSERSTYNFDIKNYSLPTTPIARSNKLRKNAWLSGDVSAKAQSTEKINFLDKTSIKEATKKQSETRAISANTSMENEADSESSSKHLSTQTSVESEDTARNSFTGLRRVDPPHDFVTYSETDEIPRERTSSWSFKSSRDSTSTKYKVEEEVLANVNVKPLVAIHERWIYEANRKTGRSMSLPEERNLKSQCQAVKPASHCVDTLQKSLPQLNVKRANMGKHFRAQPISPGSGNHWDQFCQARDTISRSVNFAFDSDSCSTWKKDSSKGTSSIPDTHKEPKVDQSTDTRSIEEFIRDLIRKEFQHLVHEISDDASTTTSVRNENILNKGVANILESLKTSDEFEPTKRESIKSFSRLKINGNNKPLLQITFSRSGENSLQVLDNCVNVTFCDGSSVGKEKVQSEEDTLTPDDIQVNSLKRCQAFNAIQEARSTEDLYIDDDLSTQMQENFGGKVKLIPLHGSLHEILCEKEDDCCLIKVKQENGCDTIYFRCDNSDTESRDAIDGALEGRPQDTVVFKRSISLIEERIQRVIPKEKRPIIIKKKTDIKSRPKSEIFLPKITKESRVLSSSSPSLIMKDGKNEEVEVNIENVMCYQDSSSDECLKCPDIDDFELLEREIEEDIANSNLTSLNCGCLEKISEENLSIINEEVTDKN